MRMQTPWLGRYLLIPAGNEQIILNGPAFL